MENIPTGNRVTPGERCLLCDNQITILDQDGDTVWLGCPNYTEDGDGHTVYHDMPAEWLRAWGWDI